MFERTGGICTLKNPGLSIANGLANYVLKHLCAWDVLSSGCCFNFGGLIHLNDCAILTSTMALSGWVAIERFL